MDGFTAQYTKAPRLRGFLYLDINLDTHEKSAVLSAQIGGDGGIRTFVNAKRKSAENRAFFKRIRGKTGFQRVKNFGK